MDLLPIKTAILSAFPPKDEPSGVCPECQEEADAPAEDFEEVLTEDSPRGDTLRDMSDMTRRMFGLPPLEHCISGREDEESGPEKD